MNELILNNISMPILNGCDFCAASEPFYHADRTAGFNVLIYVLEGAIFVTEDGIDYEVGPGTLLFLKSGIRHCGKREIPKGTRWYFVHFYFSETDVPEFEADAGAIKQYEPVKYSAPLPKMLKNLGGSRIEKEIAAFTEYFHSDSPMKKWDINLRFFSLLSDIAFYGRYDPKPPSLSDRIGAYLSAHFREPFSSKAVEGEFFLSYKHLAAVFKREKGMTMQQYHTLLRMNEACRLLRSTLMTVGEISESVGYSDMLYFSRVFRRSEGLSPTEYRKKAPEYF